jgi:hypothetical protein
MASAIPIQLAEPAAREVFGIRSTRNKLILDFFTQRRKIMDMENEIKAIEIKVEEIKMGMAKEIVDIESKYTMGYNYGIEAKVTQLIQELDKFNQNRNTPEQKNIQSLIQKINMERSIAHDIGLEIDRLDKMLPKTDKEFEALRIKYRPRATIEEIDEDLPV